MRHDTSPLHRVNQAVDCGMLSHSTSMAVRSCWILAGTGTPNMSPIEHVWDALDQRVQHVPVPANIQQLRTAIEVVF